TRTYALDITQRTPPTPGQPEKLPFHIPLAVGLLDSDGKDLPLMLEGEKSFGGTTRVLDVTRVRQSFRFVNVPAAPVPSLARGFSGVHRAALEAVRTRIHPRVPYAKTPAQMAARSLSNVCLRYLCASPDAAARARAVAQFEHADNMTDTIAALTALKDGVSAE